MLHSLLFNWGLFLGISIPVAIVVILVIVCVVWYIKTRNDFVRLRNMVEEAWATIDVYLKKRFDLIPNLVETVKGFAKHESQTLENVIAARNVAGNAKTVQEKAAAASNLTSSLRTLFNMVTENYPQLQANSNFLDLQNQLKLLEGELESARRYYNGMVKTFNTRIEIFPANIVANGMGEDYRRREYFELESPEERKNVRVSF